MSHGFANMYAFGRARQGLMRAVVALQVLGLLGGRGNNRVAEVQATVDMKLEAEVFSPQWVEEFSADKLGCESGRVSYTWRTAGFGSNINSE